MSKKKSVIFDTQKLVNHGELRVLVDHISAMMTALTARVEECERTRPVDPAVKEAGDALIASVRAQTVEAERALMLMPDDEPAVEECIYCAAGNCTSEDSGQHGRKWQEIEASLPEVPLGGKPLIEVVDR